MVVGIDALFAAIHKESERYRDSKKEEKDSLRKALLLIESSLESALIKIKLCEREGYYDTIELKLYVPGIALKINETAMGLRDTCPREIYDRLRDLVNRFVSFNKKIDSLSL